MKKFLIAVLIAIAALLVYRRFVLMPKEWALPESQYYSAVSSSRSYAALEEEPSRKVYDTILRSAYDKPFESDDGYYYLMKDHDPGSGTEDRQIFLARMAFSDDHPEVFWLTMAEKRGAFGFGDLQSISAVSIYPADRLDVMKEEMEAAISRFLKDVPQGLTVEELARYTHDYLIHECEYDYAAAEADKSGEDWEHWFSAYTAYGALVEHRAVCSGYSKAYQLLLNRLGVECVPVRGNARTDEGTGSNPFSIRMQQSDHQWNAVKDGNRWFMTDVTWDDVDDPVEMIHYFHLPISAMYQDNEAYRIDQGNFFYNPVLIGNIYGDNLFLPED